MKKYIFSLIFILSLFNTNLFANWFVRYSEKGERPSVSFVNIADDNKSILVAMFTENNIYITMYFGDEVSAKEPHSIQYSFDKNLYTKITGRQFAGFSLLYTDEPISVEERNKKEEIKRTDIRTPARTTRNEIPKKDGEAFVEKMLKANTLNAIFSPTIDTKSTNTSVNTNTARTSFNLTLLQETMNSANFNYTNFTRYQTKKVNTTSTK